MSAVRTQPEGYRIEEVRTVILNGRHRIAFKAFRRRGDRFTLIGNFTAAPGTPKRDLWKIASAFI